MRGKGLFLVVLMLLPIIIGSVTTLADYDPEKVHRIGIEAAFPPWSWREQGEYMGAAVDAVVAACDLMGIKYELFDRPWATLIPAVGEGKLEMMVSNISLKVQRDEVVDFAIPHNVEYDVVMVVEDSDLNVVTALSQGAVVGVQGGSFSDSWVTDSLVDQGVDVTVARRDDVLAVIEDMKIGRIDSIVMARTPAMSLIEAGQPVKIVGTLNDAGRTATVVAVAQGDPNGLLPLLNQGLVQVYESGLWSQIWSKYMPAGLAAPPIPSPMPDWVETYNPAPGLEDE